MCHNESFLPRFCDLVQEVRNIVNGIGNERRNHHWQVTANYYIDPDNSSTEISDWK